MVVGRYSQTYTNVVEVLRKSTLSVITKNNIKNKQ